jgi:hypothetical protein
LSIGKFKSSISNQFCIRGIDGQGFLRAHLKHGGGSRSIRPTVRFDHPAQQIVLQDYIHAVEDAECRRDRLTRQIQELMPTWSMAPVAAATPGLPGSESGPATKPTDGAGAASNTQDGSRNQDPAKVPGLPGSKSGPTVRPPSGGAPK